MAFAEAPVGKPGALAQDWGDLGDRAVKLRKRLGKLQNQIAPHVHMAATTVRRFEKGQLRRVSVRDARLLDSAYQANDWIFDSILQLMQAAWSPWFDEVHPVRSHVIQWPESLRSPVWVKVAPSDQGCGKSHTLDLSWASWWQTCTAVIDTRGVVLLLNHTQGEGGPLGGMNLDCREYRVYTLPGVGDPADDDTPRLDLRHAWRRVNHPELGAAQ